MKKLALTYGLMTGILFVGSSCYFQNNQQIKNSNVPLIENGTISNVILTDDSASDCLKLKRQIHNLSYINEPQINPVNQIFPSTNFYTEFLKSPSENYLRTFLGFSSVQKI